MQRRPCSPVTVALFAVLTCLVGCGNIQTVRSFMTAYGEPTEGERARIRVITNGMLRAVPNSACVDWRLPGAGVMVTPDKGFAQLNNHVLGLPPGRVTQDAIREYGLAVSELYVAAGKPITFFYLLNERRSDGTPECAMGRSFVPEAGVDYELVSDRAFGACVLEVRAIGKQGVPGESVSVEMSNATFCRITDNI